MDKYDYLEMIATSIDGKNAEIWDDTETWKSLDRFEYHQDDASGAWDDTPEIVGNYANDKMVIGWFWYDGFPEEKDMGTILPKMIKNGKMSLPYKKGTIEVYVWEGTLDGFNYCVLKFKNLDPNNGSYRWEHWYLVSIL